MKIKVVGIGNDTKNIIQEINLANEIEAIVILNQIENEEKILDIFMDSDIIVLIASLGTKIVKKNIDIIVNLLESMGELFVSLLTLPFAFEGKKKELYSQEISKELKKVSDLVVTLKKEKIFDIIDDNMTLKESYKLLDDYFLEIVNTMSKLLIAKSNNDIIIEFEEFKTLIKDKNLFHISVGYGLDEEAVYNALDTSLFNYKISEFNNLLVSLEVNEDYPMVKISKLMNVLYKQGSDNLSIIYAIHTNKNMNMNEVKINLIGLL